MFVVVLTYHAPTAAFLDGHRAWLDAQGDVLVASGPRPGKVGGVLLVDDMPREELDARLAADPFQAVADYDVIAFDATRRRFRPGAPGSA